MRAFMYFARPTYPAEDNRLNWKSRALAFLT